MLTLDPRQPRSARKLPSPTPPPRPTWCGPTSPTSLLRRGGDPMGAAGITGLHRCRELSPDHLVPARGLCPRCASGCRPLVLGHHKSPRGSATGSETRPSFHLGICDHPATRWHCLDPEGATIFPWPLSANSSMLYGWMFLGLSLNYGYVGLCNRWSDAKVSGVNYLGRSATIILSGWLSLFFRGGVPCVARVSVGVPGWAEHGKEPVGRLDVLGPARGAARRGGIVVAAPGTCEAVTTTRPIPSP